MSSFYFPSTFNILMFPFIQICYFHTIFTPNSRKLFHNILECTTNVNLIIHFNIRSHGKWTFILNYEWKKLTLYSTLCKKHVFFVVEKKHHKKGSWKLTLNSIFEIHFALKLFYTFCASSNISVRYNFISYLSLGGFGAWITNAVRHTRLFRAYYVQNRGARSNSLARNCKGQFPLD